MPLTFNRDFDPRYCEAIVVAPGVRRITARNPGPFTFHGTNTFLVGGPELAVIDPGPSDPAHLEALLRAIGNGTVRHVLLTHTHRDHCDGARALKAKVRAPIWAAQTGGGTNTESAADDRLDAAADIALSPDEPLADRVVVEGKGYRLEAIATPGHAADHVCFALVGENVLFSGDHVMGWSTTVVAPPGGNMRAYMASLDRLLAREETFYLPAHGDAIANAKDFVRALKTHRSMRERAILDRLEQGDRTIPEIVSRIYTNVDPKLHGAAALSTLAHLEDLVSRGLVLCRGQPSLVSAYSLGGSSAASTPTSSGTGAGDGEGADGGPADA
jgi:glyoxylase-like metal-dependent hydrolase (beta-lactamase superfamily II)